ncbi:unnamed protein product [Rhodiola kirilowii]
MHGGGESHRGESFLPKAAGLGGARRGEERKAAGQVSAYRFSSEEISSQNQVKASVQRKIRNSIAEEYPGLEPILDDLLPKKSPLIVVKCQNHLNLVVVNSVPLFFNIRDGPYMPTLRLLHQYPNVMKKFQVDRGAIKYVLSGANIMCPGLTSPGGHLDDEVGAESPVVCLRTPGPSYQIIFFSLVLTEGQLTKVLRLTTCIISMMGFGRYYLQLAFPRLGSSTRFFTYNASEQPSSYGKLSLEHIMCNAFINFHGTTRLRIMQPK